MRKCKKDQHDFLDNIFIDIAEPLCPSFKKSGFTPNGITTLSLLFGIISIIFLYRYNILAFAITYLISYFFDCMDGHFARKYKMTSDFGDMYDHFKDWTVGILLFVVLFYRYPVEPKILWTTVIGIFIIGIFTLIHVGCEEKISNGKNSKTLDFLKNICPGDATQTIKITRFFGTGTFTIVIICAVIYLNNHRLNKQ